MTGYVLDASALLALLLGEKGADYVAQRLEGAFISTVNYAEVVSHYARLGASQEDVREMLGALPLVLVDVDEGIAFKAGMMRAISDRIGLSLGDRTCLALAHSRNLPALTADKAWKEIAKEVGVKVEFLR